MSNSHLMKAKKSLDSELNKRQKPLDKLFAKYRKECIEHKKQEFETRMLKDLILDSSFFATLKKCKAKYVVLPERITSFGFSGYQSAVNSGKNFWNPEPVFSSYAHLEAWKDISIVFPVKEETATISVQCELHDKSDWTITIGETIWDIDSQPFRSDIPYFMNYDQVRLDRTLRTNAFFAKVLEIIES